jgi:hypothetical protein
MALMNTGLKVGGSIVVGAGVMLLAPIVVPVFVSAFKPVAKAAIKGSMIAYGKVREVAAETAETLEDLAAEAKAELAETPAPKPARSKKATAKK